MLDHSGWDDGLTPYTAMYNVLRIFTGTSPHSDSRFAMENVGRKEDAMTMRRRHVLPGLAVAAALAFSTVVLSGGAQRADARLPQADAPPVNELILCGGENVFILDMHQNQQPVPTKIWSWRAADR